MEPAIQELKKLRDFYGEFDYTGLSDKMLAKEFDVDVATISRWLRGKMRPRKKHLRQISQFIEQKTRELELKEG